MQVSGEGPGLFPTVTPERPSEGVQTAWRATLRRAVVQYFRIYNLRSTYATRLSASGVADEWVTQVLRQGDAQVLRCIHR